MKKDSLINSQKGAIAAEAAFVLPIVIIVIFILIYMALIQIQQGVMYMYAQGMAQKICNISAFPGYEKLYQEVYDEDYIVGYIGFPDTYKPSTQIADEIYKQHDPYRYLGGVYLSKHNSYKDELKNVVEKSMYFNGGIVSADIDTAFKNLSTAVIVNVNYSFQLPKFISIVGLNPDIMIKAKAVSYANDTAEFIRNTDLAFDLFDYFLKKYHLEEKINTFYKKIKDISEKLF